MQTWLVYENSSLNPHVTRVGLFWDIPNNAYGMEPVLWRAIEQCRFGWHHSLFIDWEPTFLLLDSWGNQRQLVIGINHCETGTRLEHLSGFGLNAQIELHQKSPRPDLTFAICRNSRPLAQMPLGFSGSCSLSMPDRLIMQIGCPVRLNNRINDRTGTLFPLFGIRTLKVALVGGTPGPRSTAQKIITHRMDAT